MNIILAAMILGAEPAIEEKTTPVTQIQAESEKKSETSRDTVAQIREDYTQGKYKETLKELDASYAEASKEEGLANLAEMRIGPVEDYTRYETLMIETLKERNDKIIKTAQGKDEEAALTAISATAPIAPETEKALSRLNQLHLLAPGKGINADENKIIDIDFEYEYKAIHLDMPLLTGQKIENLHEKHIALQMEKLDRMLEASQNFEDKDLKSSVVTTHSQFDTLLAQSSDLRKLNGISRNANTDFEKKLASILSEYGKKLSDQSKDFLDKQRAQNNADNE